MLAKMRNIGEACTAANRFHVAESRRRRVRRSASPSGMGALKVGRGTEDGVEVGPLIDDDAARARSAELVQRRGRQGRARSLTGGEPVDGPGYFYEPTVLAERARRRARLREEIFGPVAPVTTFSHRGRGDRRGQRHRVRPRRLRLHARPQPRLPRHRGPRDRHGRPQPGHGLQRRRALRRRQAVGLRPRGRPRGHRGVPGDEVRGDERWARSRSRLRSPSRAVRQLHDRAGTAWLTPLRGRALPCIMWAPWIASRWCRSLAGGGGVAGGLVRDPAAVAEAPSPAASTSRRAAIAGGPVGPRSRSTGPWTVRLTPGHGARKGWQAGAFAGGGRCAGAPRGQRPHDHGAAGLASFHGPIAWYRTTFRSRRGDVRDPLRVRPPPRHGVARRRAGRAPTPAPTCPSSSAPPGGRARRTRSSCAPTGADRRREGRRLAPHLVQLRRHQPRGYDPPDRPERARGPRRSAPACATGGARRRDRARAQPRRRRAGRRSRRADARRPRSADLPDAGVPAAGTEVSTRGATCPTRRCGPRSPDTSTTSARRPRRVGLRDAVGLRELRGTGRELLRSTASASAARRLPPRGRPRRGDALPPADMDAHRPELQAIGANATRSQHPLNPALLERLDAAGILVWLGIGPVDAPGAWTSKTPRLRRPGPERVRKTFSRRRRTRRSSRGTWPTRSPATATRRPAEFIYAAWRASCTAATPAGSSALDVWGAHPPKAPALAVPRHRRDRPDQLRRLVRGDPRRPGGGLRGDPREVRQFQRVFPAR